MKDPYVYAGTDVLINNYGIKDNATLSRVEAHAYTKVAMEGIPKGDFSLDHLKNTHKALFGEVYPWAGEIRTVDISKGDTLFCRNEFIQSEATRLLRELKSEHFLAEHKNNPDKMAERLAHYFAEINAIHPFREGNGRTNREFIRQLAEHNGMNLDFQKINREQNIQASIASTHFDNRQLENLFKNALTPLMQQDKSIEVNNTTLKITKETTTQEVLNFFKEHNSNLVENISKTNTIDYQGHQLSLEYLKPKDLANALNQQSNNVAKIELSLDRILDKSLSR